ncbi:methionyl-tRNA formyltransferase [bacterium]|nr:methionyl-tRNA formyltransferase [bacterium]
MPKKDQRIIFLGNPEFAQFHLQRFVEEGFNIVAVITAPDKPAGRGNKINSTPVTKYARKNNIPVLQPPNLKNPEFIEELRSYKADIQVVIAFRMLPEVVWDMPPMGTVNLHGSLLPQYRGAAPIHWAIINGEQVTGVTSFKLKHVIDTGNILLQKSIAIEPKETTGSLHDKLMHLGAATMIETLDGLFDGSLEEKEQLEISDEELKPAPKIFSETCEIDWNEPAEKIERLIRGLNPFPSAFTELNGLRTKIHMSDLGPDYPQAKAGDLISDGKTFLHVVCGIASVSLLEVQPAGKTRMNIDEFLRGYGQKLSLM